MECHDSSVFLIRKLPLSITEALLKSMGWSWDHAWFAILEPFHSFYSYTFIFIFRYSLLPVEDCRSSSRKLVLLNIFSQRSFLNFNKIVLVTLHVCQWLSVTS